MPSSRGSSPARDRTQVVCISGGFFTSWATGQALLFFFVLCSWFLLLHQLHLITSFRHRIPEAGDPWSRLVGWRRPCFILPVFVLGSPSNAAEHLCFCHMLISRALDTCWASLVAQTVKNPPAIQETREWSLGGEDPLEQGMATHSRILAWRIPWTEEPGGATVHGVAKSRTRLSN